MEKTFLSYLCSMNKQIRKILVANRGEIALRVMRSAKEMGIKTVAVYSEADRKAPHVVYADEAVLLGPAPSSQSYLKGDRIIEACIKLGVDAIHPGYGFLSENADFAKAVADAGLIFIGPSARSMQMMGNKLAAKQAVKDFNIPMVPGLDEAISDIEKSKQIAQEVGFPILIKAAAGGGGKGMRIVEKMEDFEEQMNLAVSEATSSFGDGSVFIEKYIGSPRHIEIQVLGDTHGNVVYLFERECSIQRRHQKLVEEAPSALLTPDVRKAMGEAAVRVAKACNYVGAGTVEFLCDEHLNFYFLEMNTRLQVEHPVTEMITGLDLVREQIRIAAGEPLGYSQEDLRIRGHAIELRVCAEDPTNNFTPDIGKLETYRRPQGYGIRVDDGMEEGMEIPVFYDPMISKLVVYGATREEAMDRMKRAIDEYQITGVATTLPFGTYVMNHPAFRSGQFDTHFIKHHYRPEDVLPKGNDQELAAILSAKELEKNQSSGSMKSSTQSNGISAWKINR